jgi:NAD-dependent histone deacetylase SIR2
MSELSLSDLVDGIQSRRFQKVAFLVGAGISVAAGIPDFRTPKIGLYAQVKKLGLPVPEDIFSLEYFLYNPKPFYTIAKEFLFYQNPQPVNAHKLMRKMEMNKQLLMVYTQNIDGLEIDAGVSLPKLVQAHGNMRSSHCVSCRSEFPTKEFEIFCLKDELFFCPNCDMKTSPAPTDTEIEKPTKVYRSDDGGVVKPDIIFFGEKLASSFSRRFQKIAEADLVIVMGTSLKVSPFSQLLKLIPETTPLVIINKELPKIVRNNVLFLEGDIETTVTKLADQIGWNLHSVLEEKPKNTTGKRKKKNIMDINEKSNNQQVNEHKLLEKEEELPKRKRNKRVEKINLQEEIILKEEIALFNVVLEEIPCLE